MSELCVIALGGNIGDVPAAFRRAASALSGAGFYVLRLSSFYQTSPVDCPPGTPDFTNAVLTGFWDGSPEDLLHLCQRIEADNGRPNNHGYHVARTLDLDIILFGSRRIRTPELTIPHPRAAERDFVLIPLREIMPELANRLTRCPLRRPSSVPLL